jgi:hypothetical protein
VTGSNPIFEERFTPHPSLEIWLQQSYLSLTVLVNTVLNTRVNTNLDSP